MTPRVCGEWQRLGGEPERWALVANRGRLKGFMFALIERRVIGWTYRHSWGGPWVGWRPTKAMAQRRAIELSERGPASPSGSPEGKP